MRRLSAPSLADCRDTFPKNQVASDKLVCGDLSDQSGQDGVVGIVPETPSYPTAWLIHHKLMQAMAEREDGYVLEGKVQVDDDYLGAERTGGKLGRGSENNVPLVAAVSLVENDRPVRVRLTPVAGFTLKAISVWARDHLAPSSTVFSFCRRQLFC